MRVRGSSGRARPGSRGARTCRASVEAAAAVPGPWADTNVGGARLDGGASGNNVVSECFREGEFINFGVTFDGGFAMGADLPLVEAVGGPKAKEVTTSTGKKAVVGPKTGFGSLSSGGLY